MKKFLSLALVMVMMLSFAACSNNAKEPETTTEQTTEAQGTTTSTNESNDTEEGDVAMETEDEYIVFNASLDFEIESDAWLGVIPTGTIYEKEVDADAVDIIYTYCENLDMDGVVSHRFAFEKDYFNSGEDGIYDIVLCSSDNEETGKVLLQIGMEKNGDQITLDYKNSK